MDPMRKVTSARRRPVSNDAGQPFPRPLTKDPGRDFLSAGDVDPETGQPLRLRPENLRPRWIRT